MINQKMLTDPILVEAKRIFDMGGAPHWLRPNSKIPVKNGWSAPERDDWKTLRAEYVRGYGLGIRLGEASNINGGYLAVLDLDIRSPDPVHLIEAVDIIDRFNSGLTKSAPLVLTGRGLGSAHFYFITKAPLQSQKLGRSKEMVKVYSPSSKETGGQKGFTETDRLTIEELKNGMRMKAAWEVELMSAGKQVVAPPTVHPDTQIRYKWQRRLE